MKLWLDDVRSAPDDSWVWVTTVADAKKHLETGEVTVCSLDHDLGLYDQTGTELAQWMADEGHFPMVIIVHSWNPAGRERMCSLLPGAHNAPFGSGALKRLLVLVEDI